MKWYLITAFVVAAAAQWFVPLTMVFRKEKVLSEGKEFRFQTEPVDPVHPFKGRYLVLRFSEETVRVRSDITLKNGDRIYAVIQNDLNNIAKVTSLSILKPSDNSMFIEAEVWYTDQMNDTKTVRLKFPFDEYYLKESNAPGAEKIYMNSLSDSLNKTFAVVKVLNGDAVLTGILIGGKNLSELLP